MQFANPYAPTDTSNDSATNAGSEIASSANSETGSRRARFVSTAFAFFLLSGLSFSSASAINGVSCPLGFELMSDLFVRTRAAMDAAELPLFSS